MPAIINLVGQRFGKLAVVRFVGLNKYRYALWECRCDCGESVLIPSGKLRTGNSKSCGCLKREATRTHGQSRCNEGQGTPEYETWRSMLARGRGTNKRGRHNYAERGITVCQRWIDSFEDFLIDMGPKPSPNHSIDRIDNNGNYEPGNCRWATKKQQDRNRRTNRLLTLNGKTMCLVEWAESLGVTSQTIINRLDTYGWCLEEALTLPKGSKPTCRNL